MKQPREIDAALREVSAHRDMRLGKGPMLSPAREIVLNDFLARELPVETALFHARTKRDRLLDLQAGIPAPVESVLHRRLGAAGSASYEIPGRRTPDRAHGGPLWRGFLRSPQSAMLATCALIAVVILCFRSWRTPLGGNAENFPRTPLLDGVNAESRATLDRFPFGRAELFARTASIRPFNLNTNEPASLQASFLANSSVLVGDGSDGPPGLRLELPVRTSLMEDGLARTP